MGQFRQLLTARYWTVRNRADGNLSGARLMWTPYGERSHVKLLIAAEVFLFFVLVQFSFTSLGGIVWLGLVVFESFFLIIMLAQMWYDDLLWATRAIRASPNTRIPWRPNLYIWEKRRGKYAKPNPVRGERPAEWVREKAAKTTRYGISFGGEVEQWLTGEPKDGPIIIAPIIAGADPPKSEGDSGVGTGHWDGLDYIVQGMPHIYFLGRDDFTRGIEDPTVNRLLLGLDQEVRALIYKLRPNSKWYRPVIYYEELPENASKPPTSPLDLSVVLDNMDLRAQLDRARREAQKIMAVHERSLDRMR